MSINTSVTAVKPGVSSGSAVRSSDSPEKIRKAAQQFEALIIEQMLQSVRESSFGGGWGTSGSDPAGDTALQMADQQMAQMISAKGGLGLAQLIETGLKRSLVTPTHSSLPKGGASGSKP